MRLPAQVPPPVWLLLAAGVGCTPEGPKPLLTGVLPDWGYSGADTEVRIEGDRFLPRLEARGAQDISVDDQFTLVLETDPPTPLRQTDRLSDSLLEALVPAGIPPGRYDLRVTGPSGASDRLAGAFTVTDTQAATIGVSIAAVRYDVREDARVELQLRDLSGADVPAPIDVEVRALAASGDPSAVVFRSGLVDQEALEPGVIRGSLDSGGGADLYFTSTAVDDVALEIMGLGLNDHISVVSPQLRFEPAAIDDLSIGLPDTPLVVDTPTALDLQLLDADGNPTRGELLVATVQETCSPGSSGYTDVVTIPDQITLTDVVLTGATVGGGCAENRIRVVGAVGSEVLVVETPPLEVFPADIARYDVLPVSEEVVAGEGVQNVVVRAEDTRGNPIADHVASLTLTDNIGGLDPEDDVGSAACGAFFEGQTVCSVVLERAGSSVTIQVTDDDGITGISRDFSVLAGSPSSIDIELPEADFEAGETFLVRTQARDDFGNPASLDDVGGSAAVLLTDSTGSLGCAARFDGPSNGLTFSSCFVETADPAVTIDAAVPALGLSATSDPFLVTNGELAVVDFTLASHALTAGDPLDFQIEATDAFGNPYTVQATSSVLVLDQGGELTSTSVVLDADGAGSGTVTLERATPANRLLARVFGSTLGESDPFSVEAGPHAGFSVDAGSTWVALDDAVDVQVTAVDAYGNPLDDVDTVLDLSSTAGAADPVSAVSMVDGLAEGTLYWDTAVLQDTIEVDDGTFAGSSDPIDAVDFDCSGPPVADLTVAGDTDLRLCLVAGQTSEVTLSAAGSTAGDASLAAYHLHTGDSPYTRDTSAESTERWDGPGARVVEVVVVDDDGCADLARARVWVGESDGEPVGPVQVVLDDDTLTAGSSTAGATTARFAARDCAGDPSSGGMLWVRSDLGTLASGTSALTATGSGLALVLDSNGEGDLAWSVAADTVAGDARVHAGVPGGAAHGMAEAAVSGDARAPIPVEVAPVGATAAVWSTIEVAFSEPMYATSVRATAFSLTDPDGLPVTITDATLSSDGTRVTVEPALALDGSAGTWTFSVDSTLRDDGGGNFLDGAWSGAPSDLTVELGDVVESAPVVSACTPSASVFRPDGDDGTGPDADQVSFAVTAASTPEWWWLEVRDADGAVVVWQPTAASSATDTLTWDGRGTDGFVVSAGTYTATVTALDPLLADNTACSNVLTVEHPIDAPESP